MIEVKITPDDGEPYRLDILSRDVLVWERTGKGRSFGTLMDDISMVAVYHLAWIAARRLGHFSGDLKVFEETCEVDMETDDEETAGEPDPTQPAQLAVASSRSPSRPASPRRSGPRRATAK